MKTHKPKTIIEAIDNLKQFLEADLYSKFRPIEYIKGEEWKRKDSFKSEKDFYEYLEEHFELLIKQIKEISENITKKKK